LRDEVGGAVVYYPPGAFGQANPLLHARAVRATSGAPQRWEATGRAHPAI
jgi:hypothetical protein